MCGLIKSYSIPMGWNGISVSIFNKCRIRRSLFKFSGELKNSKLFEKNVRQIYCMNMGWKEEFLFVILALLYFIHLKVMNKS